jgi:protoporphyrinogen oxidase
MRATPKVVIIGAGPTGLGAAWRLHELGADSWHLVESASSAGGLASSVTDDRGFVWDHGGHVIFSHYEYFDRLLDGLLGDQWEDHVRESWIWMRERFIPYPFQHNIWHLPPEDVLACIDGLLELHGNGTGHYAPKTFREWILRSFGQGIADVFLLPYNFKVWAYDPAELNVGWMGERVATVDLARTLRNLVLRRDDAGWGPNARFRFPRHGGTGAIWRTLAERLPREALTFGRSVTAVRTRERRVELDDGTTHEYDYLLSSMPLDRLVRLLADQPDLGAFGDRFKHSSSHIVGIGLEGRVPESLATKCWMYFPEANVPCYRATVFSNYSPNNVPRPGQQWSLMAEVSESPAKPVDAARVANDTLNAFRAIGFIPAHTAVASLWHCRLEHGYPTPFVGRDEVLAELDPRLRELGIFSRGRFGAWKYEVSNQDHSLMQGVEAVDHLLFGAEETTYHHPSVVNASKGLGRRPREAPTPGRPRAPGTHTA